MTPHQMARDECANWVMGECIGRPDGKCLLASQRPCDYFKDFVLPLADRHTRYGIVVGQFNGMVARRRRERPARLEELFRAFGRQDEAKAPCGKCLNCLNGHRQICLSTLKLPSPQSDDAPALGKIVLFYCRKCKTPLYAKNRRYCEICGPVAAREKRKASKRNRRSLGATFETSKPIENKGPQEAV